MEWYLFVVASRQFVWRGLRIGSQFPMSAIIYSSTTTYLLIVIADSNAKRVLVFYNICWYVSVMLLAPERTKRRKSCVSHIYVIVQKSFFFVVEKSSLYRIDT